MNDFDDIPDPAGCGCALIALGIEVLVFILVGRLLLAAVRWAWTFDFASWFGGLS